VTTGTDWLALFFALCLTTVTALIVALRAVFFAGAARATFRVAPAWPMAFFTAVFFDAFLLAAFFAIFSSAFFGDGFRVFYAAALREPVFFAGAVRREPPAWVDFFRRPAPTVGALPFLAAFFAGFRATFFAITGS